MINKPAPWPDIYVRSSDLPKTWTVPIQRGGVALDLSSSSVSTRLYDDSVLDGSLDVNLDDAADGIVRLTLTQAMYDAAKIYSTWQLRENSVLNAVVAQGRLIKRL